MDWLMLNDEKQLAEIHQLSFDTNNIGVLLFKHSTRCSVSDVALNRLERNWKLSSETLPTYFLDLLKHRSISSEIANKYAIPHESPQILIIKRGKCIYTSSHLSIDFIDVVASITFPGPSQKGN